MQMFLQTLFPVSLGRANVATVARSASVLINYTRQKRLGESILEVEAGRKTFTCFEYDSEFAKWTPSSHPCNQACTGASDQTCGGTNQQ